jgi:hypothetical protein
MALHVPIQIRRSTSLDRYPAVFARAAEITAANPSRHILSFGCSTGEECVTLADRYFRQDGDRIVGVDVAAKAISRARRRNARERVRHLTSEDARVKPLRFDVIFAMAVLCLHDTLYTPAADVPRLFPFARFSEACAELDAMLDPGGLLVICNASYRFADTALAPCYAPIEMPMRSRELLVPIHQPDGTRIITRGPTEPLLWLKA